MPLSKPSLDAELRLLWGPLAKRREEADVTIINNPPRKIEVTDKT